MKQKPVIVIGANYGSESKGLVAAEICKERNAGIMVRTGSINAGHTIPYNGVQYKMQQIPVGWVNPKTKLVIGAGAYIHPDILDQEVDIINRATGEDVRERLFIDVKCGLHTSEHHRMETDARLHQRMGSTGEGCMEAIIDKMRRGFEYKPFSQTVRAREYRTVDTVKLLNTAIENGELVIFEGTQGTMLDLHVGYYPFVTSRQTIASAWLAEAGVAPQECEVVLVSRTYPIRVAGNSGPMPGEISWADLIESIDSKRARYYLSPLVNPKALASYKSMRGYVATEFDFPDSSPEGWDADTRRAHAEKLSEFESTIFSRLSDDDRKEIRNLLELTTVTLKPRRISRLSLDEMAYAAKVNGASYIALNFLNYEFPLTANEKTMEGITELKEYQDIKRYIKNIEETVGIPVRYVNTNPWGIIKYGE